MRTIMFIFLFSIFNALTGCGGKNNMHVKSKELKTYTEAPAPCAPSPELIDFKSQVVDASATQRSKTESDQLIEVSITDNGINYRIRFYHNHDIHIEEVRLESTTAFYDYCGDGTLNAVKSPEGGIEYSDGSLGEATKDTENEWWWDFKYRKVRGNIGKHIKALSTTKKH